MDLEHTAIPTPAPGRWWPAAWHTALPALLSLCLGYGLAVGAPHAITPRVSVIDSNGRLHTAMMRTTVGDTLAAAGIALGPQDHVIPALEAPVPTPRRIHIVRAIPVTIQGPDRTFTIWTTADDVSGLKTHPDLKL
ncbi:MAG TPA: ubiquitin-like domain-containing protein, partial [bacterium]|nr:ubiquitin-like domain-containing protein [bacterium]